MDEWVDKILDDVVRSHEARGGLVGMDRGSLASILDKYLFDSMVLTVGEVDYLAINVDALTDSQWDLIRYILTGEEANHEE